MNRKQTLDAAAACVLTDRQRTHGPIEDSFGLIASLWSAYLSVPVTPFAVANMMTLLKIARAKGNPANADNQVDGAGYQACAAELAEPVAAPAKPPVLVGDRIDSGTVGLAARAAQIRREYEASIRSHIAVATPNAAPVTPESSPEGDHSQTDVRTQGDAIPLDSDGMWHNPENFTLSEEEKASGWRFLTKGETELPDDTMFKDNDDGTMLEWDLITYRHRAADVTYFTKTPLPGTPHLRGNPASDGAVIPEPEWHNPENISPFELADGWRFMTVEEWGVPDDAEIMVPPGKWVAASFRGAMKAPHVTYRTKAPLPGIPSADNVHATTP